MTEPNNNIARRVWAEVEPTTYKDEELGNPLLRFIEAWTKPLIPLDDIVRDDVEAGIAGYGKVMDPLTAPDSWLPWLARLTGTRLMEGEDVTHQRNRINGMEGLRRGSAQAMRSAATHSLTGNKYVIFNERYQGSAYKLAIRTLASETPDPAAVLRDLMFQKPAGIILDYATVTGVTYNTILAARTSYTNVVNTYATYGQMLINLP
jgi:hypothetical protein